MQVDEKALEAAYEAGRDYVMDMDDRTKQMIRVCVRAYLSALGEQKPVAWQGRDHQDDRWNFLRKGIIYLTPLAVNRSHFTSSGFKLRRTINRKSLAYPSGIGTPLAYPWLVRMDTPRNSAAPA